jgi:hypothetical protein
MGSRAGRLFGLARREDLEKNMKATFREQTELDADKLAKSRSNGGQAIGKRNRMNKAFGFNGGTLRTTRFDTHTPKPKR